MIRHRPTKAPTPLALGLGLRQAALCIAGIVLTPVGVIGGAGIASALFGLYDGQR